MPDAPQLVFELATAGGSSSTDITLGKRRWRLLRRASDVREALSVLAYEVQWAQLIRNGTQRSVQLGCHLARYSKPQGHGVCDHNGFERKANILTSIPYVAVGLHTMQKRQTPAGRAYGASLVGVGLGSMTYHASSSRWRSAGRKLDYWAIALASAALVRVSRPGMPKAATGLSLALTPFQPFAVVSVNGAIAEVDFLRRAQARPHLRRSHYAHVAASALGAAAFIGEEFAPKAPLIHTAWHLLSAAGLAAKGAILEDIERLGPLPQQ